MSSKKGLGMALGCKLLACLLAILCVVLALSYSSWRAIGTLGGMLDTAASASVRKLGAVDEIRAGFQNMGDHAKKTQLAHAIHNLEQPGGTCSGCHSIDDPAADRAAFEAAGAKVQRTIAGVRPLMTDSGSRDSLDLIERGLRNWVSLYPEYLTKAGANDFDSAHGVIMDKLLPVLDSIDKATDQLKTAQRNYLKQANDDARGTTAWNRGLALALIGLCLVVVVGAMLVVRGATRGLRSIALALSERAGGVAREAESVSNSSQELAQEAQDQILSLEEVAESGSSIQTTAEKNTASAEQSAEVSGQVGGSLVATNAKLTELMSAMKAIEGASGKVARIVRVIDEIAFQTNILALNAAVEAARAGETGLGFAVVAGEVRNLAQRSADAAKETASLIEEAITASQNGMAKLDGVAGAFRSLEQGAQTITRLAGDVRSASLEQAEKVLDISGKITRMRQSTQTTANGATECAKTGSVLSGEAENLNQLAGTLVAIVGCGSGVEEPA
jgi:methyl-accepting chemotaxis protein